MTIPLRTHANAVLVYIFLIFATYPAQAGGPTGMAEAARSTSNDAGSGEWTGFGRTPDEQHYSPLTQISDANVAGLNLAWYFDILGSVLSVSIPLEADGVLYFVSGQGLLRALNAASGRLLWSYDPQTFKTAGQKLRVWGTRGIAYWGGKVYEGLTDGRLIAVDARNGRLVWSVQTTSAADRRYITGAPRIFDGKVIIGHGGGDVGAQRCYVTAYDARNGQKLWRFFITPGDPAEGFENDAMKMAAKTWPAGWWKQSGGGAVWNAITYDSELHRIYLGTGNPSPWNANIRDPAGLDNLFTDSIVALQADTGKYLWHYQTTPGDAWDFDAAEDIELATLLISGKPRKVMMQASKNGFFYLIDRETGKLISAENFTKVTWAKRIDLATGRPIEAPNARYRDGKMMLWPGNAGAHASQPMSFSPRTGLAYIPSYDMPQIYDDEGIDRLKWKAPPVVAVNSGVNMPNGSVPTEFGISALIAWDPVRQKEAWREPLSSGWHGGTVVTAGNLVFHGRADGRFMAYAADTGKVLWTYDSQAGIIAAPISYEVGGRQYISVMTGYTGPGATYGDLSAQYNWQARIQQRRLLTFSLAGGVNLPPQLRADKVLPINDPSYVSNPALEAEGSESYVGHCIWCHGGDAIAGGHAPDLRSSPLISSPESFRAVVQAGALQKDGMPKYDDMTGSEIEAVRQYLRARANRLQTKELEKHN